MIKIQINARVGNFRILKMNFSRENKNENNNKNIVEYWRNKNKQQQKKIGKNKKLTQFGFFFHSYALGNFIPDIWLPHHHRHHLDQFDYNHLHYYLSLGSCHKQSNITEQQK